MLSEPKYQILSKLGQGAYGTVMKAINKETSQTVAIKSIKINPDDEGISSTTIRQMTILKNLNHPNIVKLLDVKMNVTGLDPKIQLIFQFVNEDLSKFIRRTSASKKLEHSLVKDIMYQILLGVQFMHNKKVFHRDLKPHNILFDGVNKIKIADFGLGRIVGKYFQTMSKQIETLWYRAPQLLLGTTRYDFGVDVWSIGCIFYQLAQGKVLFQTQSEIGQIFEIMKQLGTPSLSQWEQILQYPHFKQTFPKFKKKPKVYYNLCDKGINLLEKMIVMDPKKRISVKQALKHPYFA